MTILEQTADLDDKTLLADIYVAALEDSLTAIGRFNARTLRATFLDYYDDFSFIKIVYQGHTVGFYSTVAKVDHVWLVHLYINPSCQGLGLGSAVLQRVMAAAKSQPLPVRLTAIAGSRANDFYTKNGFQLDAEEGSNNHYVLAAA
jgi:GNAT superfamily N-acetyltransferase